MLTPGSDVSVASEPGATGLAFSFGKVQNSFLPPLVRGDAVDVVARSEEQWETQPRDCCFSSKAIARACRERRASRSFGEADEA